MRDHMANSKPYISFVLLFTFLLSCQAHKHSYNDEGNNLEHPTLSQDLGKDWRRGYNMPNRMSLHRYDFQWAQPLPPIAKRDPHAQPVAASDHQIDPPETESDHHTYSVDHHGDLPAAKSDRQIGSIDYYRDPPETDRHHTYSVDYHRDPPASKSDHHRNVFHGQAPHPDAKPGFYTHSTTGYHRHGFQWAEPPPPETRSDRHTYSVDFVDFPPPIPAAETKSYHHTYSTDNQRASLEDIEPSKNYEDGTVTRHRKMMKPSETGDIDVVP